MNLTFRPLRADEIDCRVGSMGKDGCSLLLYKDARCDQILLDEAVGPMGWQRHHSRDNANCTVSIYDTDFKQWVEKEDTGTESNTEKEKGLASDSFKRACFNWGIGRELYTAPFIWIPADRYKTKQTASGKTVIKGGFKCTELAVTDGKITALAIGYSEFGRDYETVFSLNGKLPKAPKKPADEDKQVETCKQCGAAILPKKARDGKWLTSVEVAKSLGGLCVNCYREAKKHEVDV